VDPATRVELPALLAHKDAIIAEQAEQIGALIRANDRLVYALRRLKRQLFGRKAEWIDPNQLPLLGDVPKPEPEVVAPEPEKPEPKTKRSRHGRSRLPSRLPVQEIKTQVVDRACSHCGGELKTIGEIVSERLDYVPGHFVRLNLVREKCACPSCPSEGVRVADVPHFAIDRALCGDGLLAHVTSSSPTTIR
jgi:transposase